MAAGGGAGVITVWNLEERRLHTIIRVKLYCLQGQSVLLLQLMLV